MLRFRGKACSAYATGTLHYWLLSAATLSTLRLEVHAVVFPLLRSRWSTDCFRCFIAAGGPYCGFVRLCTVSGLIVGPGGPLIPEGGSHARGRRSRLRISVFPVFVLRHLLHAGFPVSYPRFTAFSFSCFFAPVACIRTAVQPVPPVFSVSGRALLFPLHGFLPHGTHFTSAMVFLALTGIPRSLFRSALFRLSPLCACAFFTAHASLLILRPLSPSLVPSARASFLTPDFCSATRLSPLPPVLCCLPRHHSTSVPDEFSSRAPRFFRSFAFRHGSRLRASVSSPPSPLCQLYCGLFHISPCWSGTSYPDCASRGLFSLRCRHARSRQAPSHFAITLASTALRATFLVFTV